MPLPPLSFEHEVTADEGREDKIDLSLGNWMLSASRAQLRDIRNYLAVPPVNARVTADWAVSYGYLFNRPQTGRGKMPPLRIRNRPIESAARRQFSGKPLFGGEWVAFDRGRASSPLFRRFESFLYLSLNPLRFVRHQAIPRPIGAPDTWGVPRITEAERPLETGGEFALDGKDNWLPDRIVFNAFAKAERWPHHLRLYVFAVGDALTAELERVTARHTGQFLHIPDFRLRKVETAFEFAATEPTELLRSFSQQLMAYRADDFSIQHFPAPEILRVENALSLKTTIRQGVSLRVYAKTNRRIRFEIIHERINHRALLGESRQPTGAATPQRDWTRLLDCLAILRQRSADEMNSLFRYMRNRSSVPRSQITPLGLLVQMASAIENYEMTHTVASLLAEFSVIASRKASCELLAALHALARNGIVKFDRQRRGYAVTPPYRQALHLLSSEDTFRLLVTARSRPRRRS